MSPFNMHMFPCDFLHRGHTDVVCKVGIYRISDWNRNFKILHVIPEEIIPAKIAWARVWQL